MIVHLEKDKIKPERWKLLNDIVYVIFHDALKQWQKDNVTKLLPVELFLSAKDFAKTILGLPDVMEGLEEEMEDLEDEAEGDNDAMIIMMLASGIFQAIGTHRIGFESKPVIMKIYERWNDHPLFFSFLDEGCKKEQARWLKGKKTNLLTYELQQIEADGEGEEAVRQVFEYFIGISEHVDKESIKGSLVILNKYNLDHGNAYVKEMNALYEKFGIKSSTIVNAKEHYGVKYVENEFGNIAEGATGVAKHYHKD